MWINCIIALRTPEGRHQERISHLFAQELLPSDCISRWDEPDAAALTKPHN